jgi:Ni2+-binding GTPase involved in maturation of urease and hydrogenase
MSKEDIVADIRNKLGPFWALIDIMLIDDEDLPEDQDAYSQLMQDTAFKCRENQDLITSKLDELLQ